MGAFQTTVRMFDGLMYLLVLVAGSLFMLKGLIDPGDLVAYIMYVSTLIATIRRIIEFAEQFQRGMTGIERFLQIMDADIEIFDEEGSVELHSPEGEIAFHNVSFEYPDDHNQVFANLNLTVHPGEKVAIVGPSGGGKTTLCSLIPRFYDVGAGSIKLDGIDVRDVKQRSLRRSIGVVQQDVFLFAASILDNIRYGRPGATNEEVIAAAKRAEIYDDIMAMPDGFETYVGERGTLLSGGQKQRISIARIFLKDPPVLILDEATSALDSVTESKIQRAFDELAKGRTTLIIAHRLSTVRNAHRILVIRDGVVSEEGTHQALLEKDGDYAQLYRTQNLHG